MTHAAWICLLALAACGKGEVSTPAPEKPRPTVPEPEQRQPTAPEPTAPEPTAEPSERGFDVLARAASGEVGCVGITRDGQTVLAIVASIDTPPPGDERKVARLERAIAWRTLGAGEPEGAVELESCRATDDCERHFAEQAALAAKDSSLGELVRARTWLSCETVAVDEPAKIRGVELAVRRDDKGVSVRAGSASVVVFEPDPDAEGLDGVRLHYADDAPSVFVELQRRLPDESADIERVELRGVAGRALGIAP